MLSKLCPEPQSTQQVDATYHYFKGNIGNKTFHPCVLRMHCSLHYRFLTNFSAHKLLIKFDVPFASALKSTLTAIHLEAVSQLRRG